MAAPTGSRDSRENLTDNAQPPARGYRHIQRGRRDRRPATDGGTSGDHFNWEPDVETHEESQPVVLILTEKFLAVSELGELSFLLSHHSRFGPDSEGGRFW